LSEQKRKDKASRALPFRLIGEGLLQDCSAAPHLGLCDRKDGFGGNTGNLAAKQF